MTKKYIILPMRGKRKKQNTGQVVFKKTRLLILLWHSDVYATKK